MSDINLDFTVSNNSIDFTVQPNDITITPSDIQLAVFAGGVAPPAGATGELQYNNNGILGGAFGTSYVNGNLTLQVANTKITGGNNHYYLQTDGTGNLTWSVGTGNMQGNGTVAGANTQIQFNDNGMNFGGNAGFTFDKITGNVDIPGNLIVVGNIFGNISNANYANFAGQVVDATQSNITSLGTLVSLSVAGTSTIQQAKEKVTANNVAPTGTINYNLLDQAIILNTTAASNNFTLNFRGNSSVTLDTVMSSNQSMTCTYVNLNTANAYYANVIQIDGNVVVPYWSTVLAGSASARDVYTFNIIKTAANTFSVFGSVIGYA